MSKTQKNNIPFQANNNKSVINGIIEKNITKFT